MFYVEADFDNFTLLVLFFLSSQIPTRGMSRRILISHRLAPFCRSIGVDVVFFSRQWNMAHLARLLQSHVTWNEPKGGQLTDWLGHGLQRKTSGLAKDICHAWSGLFALRFLRIFSTWDLDPESIHFWYVHDAS